MQRAWDVIVGSFMMLTGLGVSLVPSALLGMPISFLFPGEARQSPAFGWTMLAVMMVLMNSAAFADFYWRRRINRIYGTAGVIHLVPRGFERILRGRKD